VSHGKKTGAELIDEWNELTRRIDKRYREQIPEPPPPPTPESMTRVVNYKESTDWTPIWILLIGALAYGVFWCWTHAHC
jgi:hypothetical protein